MHALHMMMILIYVDAVYSNQGICIAPPSRRLRAHRLPELVHILVSTNRTSFQFMAKWVCRLQQVQICR